MPETDTYFNSPGACFNKDKQPKNVNDILYFCLETMLMFILRDFFVAGVETVASTMTWTILILANRPQVQEKVVNKNMCVMPNVTTL